MSDRRVNRRRFVAAVAALSVTGVSGCGSDGETTDEPGDGEPTSTEMPTATALPDEDTPGEMPTDTPTDASTDAPAETPAETPTEAATDTPTPSAADLAEWPTYMYNDQNWGDHPDAVGPTDGVSVAWQRDLDRAHVNATAVLADGTLFVGDGRPNDDAGTLYALDPLTGETDWRVDLSAPVLGGTVVDESGNVYIAAGATFLGLRGDGGELWSFQNNTGLNFASPTVTDDTVYFGADSGRLFAIDKLSSAREWTYATSGTIPSAPAVQDGTVYLPSRDGTVYALDAGSGSEEWTIDRGTPVNGLSVRDDRVFAALEGGRVLKADTRGNVIWAQPVGGAAATTPAVTESMLYVGTREDAFVAIDRGDGIEQWRFDDTDSPFSAPPVVVDGTVYVGCQDNSVYALDAETGEQQWSHATSGAIVDPAPVVSGNTVFIGSRDGNFYALGG